MKLVLSWVLEISDWIFNQVFLKQAIEIAVYSWKSNT